MNGQNMKRLDPKITYIYPNLLEPDRSFLLHDQIGVSGVNADVQDLKINRDPFAS